jgi:hypothetical protein
MVVYMIAISIKCYKYPFQETNDIYPISKLTRIQTEKLMCISTAMDALQVREVLVKEALIDSPFLKLLSGQCSP